MCQKKESSKYNTTSESHKLTHLKPHSESDHTDAAAEG